MVSLWSPKTETDLPSEPLREAVMLHLERHLGEPDLAYSDQKGWSGQGDEPGPPVDVLVIPPEGERRFAYVSTFGCSLRPLPAPAYQEAGTQRRAEFVIAAPQHKDEEENQKALNLAANTVRQFAKLTHMQPVTIETGETVSFSEVPTPVFDDTELVAFAFSQPRLPSDGFATLQLDSGEEVSFVAPIPITQPELDLARELGPRKLYQKLFQEGVTEMLDFSRKAVKTPEKQPKRGFFSKILRHFSRKR